MPKLLGPLFSVKATGALGGSLTYQNTKGQPIVRARTSHPDAQTPAQLSQRWLYALGIGQWMGFSPAQRAPYVAAAVGQPLTPMNAWLRTWLTTTPDLAFGIPCQQASGPTAFDRSQNAWNAALTGVTWAPRPTGYSLLADGLDDYASLPNVGDLPLTSGNWTILFRGIFHRLRDWDSVLQNRNTGQSGYGLTVFAPGFMRLATYQGALGQTGWSTNGSIIVDELATFAATLDVPDSAYYKDGIDITGGTQVHIAPLTGTQLPTLFNRPPFSAGELHMTLYSMAVFTRTLTVPEIQQIGRALERLD